VDGEIRVRIDLDGEIRVRIDLNGTHVSLSILLRRRKMVLVECT
jgi:hypothetical protein